MILFANKHSACSWRCGACGGQAGSTYNAAVVSNRLTNTAPMNPHRRQPVFLTLCHMLACCALAYTLALTHYFPIRPLKSRRQLWKVCLLATIFCFTIVLGNMSLRFIAVSFSQALGSGTPFFTAVFALLLQGDGAAAVWFFCGALGGDGRLEYISPCNELALPCRNRHSHLTPAHNHFGYHIKTTGARESPTTYATLIPIVAGVLLASGGEPQFHLFGFVACVLATAGRALKSVVQAMLMGDPTERLDPMSLLFYMSRCGTGCRGLVSVGWLQRGGFNGFVAEGWFQGSGFSGVAAEGWLQRGGRREVIYFGVVWCGRLACSSLLTAPPPPPPTPTASACCSCCLQPRSSSPLHSARRRCWWQQTPGSSGGCCSTAAWPTQST